MQTISDSRLIGLSNTDFQSIIHIFASNSDIDTVFLYGSRAKGNFRKGSDIDITLSGSALTLRDLNQIELALDNLMLPYSFDISLLTNIDNQELLEHIERVGLILYQKSMENL
ncbi:MAG: nucleotidyltransferase domain-containing protein [Bacteroidetes bacterium]|nr:nucleotidyltransferase domain-containing protein [Bacteroidota bacterium]